MRSTYAGRILSFSLLALLAVSTVAGAQTLYSVAQGDDQLRVVDPTDASTVSSVTITLAGETVLGATGLATQPGTNTLFALIRNQTGQTPRILATLDPATGVATAIGSTGDAFAGLAFACDGTLYGVTGDGGTVPETLFEINPATGAATQVLALGNGTDGETIALDPVDGLMYHASGHSGDDEVFFESINLSSLVVTDIPIAGTALTEEEAQALTWWPAQGEFLWKQYHGAPGPLFRVTTGGVPTLIGDLDHQAKGLAFVPNDGCSAVVRSPLEIPTLDSVGLAALVVALGAAAWIGLRRRTVRE